MTYHGPFSNTNTVIAELEGSTPLKQAVRQDCESVPSTSHFYNLSPQDPSLYYLQSVRFLRGFLTKILYVFLVSPHPKWNKKVKFPLHHAVKARSCGCVSTSGLFVFLSSYCTFNLIHAEY